MAADPSHAQRARDVFVILAKTGVGGAGRQGCRVRSVRRGIDDHQSAGAARAGFFLIAAGFGSDSARIRRNRLPLLTARPKKKKARGRTGLSLLGLASVTLPGRAQTVDWEEDRVCG
jgi:hypothetical protein